MGTLDFREAEFWEAGKVDQELRRVYDICSGCRRCLPLCPSFKVLFDRIDVPAVDGDVEKLPVADVKEVVDLCYQCKLCFNHCPYTPPHRWEVDFPRLMLRARAAQARGSGVKLQDRVLGNTDLVGKLGSLTAPLSNRMSEVSLHRAFMQAVLGIHKDRNLPRFHRPTFSAWFRRRSAPSRPTPGRARWRSSRHARWSTTTPASGGPPCACWRRTAWTWRCPPSAAAACPISTAGPWTRPAR
jgi:ferredoxin